MSSRRQVKVSS